jgi:NAD(P)-dependent dehydrogenase (short-subunit alcohol dehydrogenase family)
MSYDDPRIDDVAATFSSDAMRGKGCVVTGAGGGIGRGTAVAFAGAGADVVITDVREDALEETARIIEARTGRRPAASVAADVSSPDVGDIVIGAAANALDGLHALVNCAGISRGDAEHETLERWHHVLATNLDSIWILSNAALPRLRANGGGAIVNIASIIAARSYRAMRGHHAYPSSKAGILGLTQSMAMTFGQHAVRVNAISPGLIRTPLGARFAASAERLNAAGAGIPIGLVGEPSDIAAAALFLASDAARYITGTELVVDGGMSAEVGWDRFLTPPPPA